MKLGGLFSGIGGFELAWERLGHEVAWVCEIDKSAQRVLSERFPNATIYDDVSELDPSEVEPVDVMTGGSPCQGFSVAGLRSGLEHGESRLFADYVRVLDGLAERGLRYAVWENVPGVLSITNDDGEYTYEHVVAALVGAGEPVRLDRAERWNTGMAARHRRAVAWRVLDSRYFGVAQRRRRVFAVVALGDTAEDRAGRALLALAEGVQRDPETSDAQGQDAAGTAHEGARASRGAGAGRDGRDGRRVVPAVAGTLGAKGSGGVDDLDRMTFVPDLPEHGGAKVAHTLTGTGFDASEDGTGRGTPIVPDLPEHTGPLTTGVGHARGTETTDSHHVFVDTPAVVPIQDAREIAKEQNGLGIGDEGAPSYTLDTASAQAVGPVPIGRDDTLAFVTQSGDDYVPPLVASDALGPGNTQDGKVVGVEVDGPIPYRKAKRAQSVTDDETWVADGDANTLTPFDSGDTRTTHAVVEAFGLSTGAEPCALEDEAPTVTGSNRQPGTVAFTQNQREEVRVLGDETGALSAAGGSHQTNYLLDPVDDEVESLTPWPEMGQAMRVYGTNGVAPTIAGPPSNVMEELEEPFCIQGSVEGRSEAAGPGGRGWKQGESFTLNTADRHAVTDAPSDDDPETVDLGSMGTRVSVNADTASTLQACGGGMGAKTGLYMTEMLEEGVAYDGYNQQLEIGTHRALRIGRDSSDFVTDDEQIRYGVRRLTPTECERLQAFPDGWTTPAGSDSARYKALGNAVTVNTVHWILRRILEVDERLGSD